MNKSAFGESTAFKNSFNVTEFGSPFIERRVRVQNTIARRNLILILNLLEKAEYLTLKNMRIDIHKLEKELLDKIQQGMGSKCTEAWENMNHLRKLKNRVNTEEFERKKRAYFKAIKDAAENDYRTAAMIIEKTREAEHKKTLQSMTVVDPNILTPLVSHARSFLTTKEILRKKQLADRAKQLSDSHLIPTSRLSEKKKSKWLDTENLQKDLVNLTEASGEDTSCSSSKSQRNSQGSRSFKQVSWSKSSLTTVPEHVEPSEAKSELRIEEKPETSQENSGERTYLPDSKKIRPSTTTSQLSHQLPSEMLLRAKLPVNLTRNMSSQNRQDLNIYDRSLSAQPITGRSTHSSSIERAQSNLEINKRGYASLSPDGEKRLKYLLSFRTKEESDFDVKNLQGRITCPKIYNQKKLSTIFQKANINIITHRNEATSIQVFSPAGGGKITVLSGKKIGLEK